MSVFCKECRDGVTHTHQTETTITPSDGWHYIHAIQPYEAVLERIANALEKIAESLGS